MRRILAMTLAILLSGISLRGQTAPLGVISQSVGAHINNSSASIGTTVYDSDRLSTEANGSLTLRSSAVQLILSENSAVLVNQDEKGLRAMLQRGTVAFKVEASGALRLNAVDVRVRPQGDQSTAGQMTLENCAVLVTSRLRRWKLRPVQKRKSLRKANLTAWFSKAHATPARTRFALLSRMADFSPFPLLLAS